MQFLRGSRDYCQGVQVHLPENSSDNVVFCFFSPQLILQFYRGCPMVISKKTISFKQRGSNFFKGGGWGGRATFSMGGGGPMGNFYRNPYNLWFSRGGEGGRTPYPPSGSAHAISQLIFLISKGNISCGFPKDPSQEDDSFEHQNKCLDL